MIRKLAVSFALLLFPLFMYAAPAKAVASDLPVLNRVPPVLSAKAEALSVAAFAYIHYEGGVRLPYSAMNSLSCLEFFFALKYSKDEYFMKTGVLPEIYAENPLWLMIPFQDYRAWQGSVLSIHADTPDLAELIVVDEYNSRISYKDASLEHLRVFSGISRSDYVLPSGSIQGSALVFIKLSPVKTWIADMQLQKIPAHARVTIGRAVLRGIAYSLLLFSVIMAFVFLTMQKLGNPLVFILFLAYSMIFCAVELFSGSLSFLGLGTSEILFTVYLVSCLYPLVIFFLSAIWNKIYSVQLVYLFALLSFSLILCSTVVVKAYSFSEAALYFLVLTTSVLLLMRGFRDSFSEKPYEIFYLMLYGGNAAVSLFLFAATFFPSIFPFGLRSAILFGLMLFSMAMISVASIVGYLKWGRIRDLVFSAQREKEEKLLREKQGFITSVAALLSSPLNHIVSLLEDRDGGAQRAGFGPDSALAKNEAVNLLNIVSNIVSYVNLKDGSRNLTAEPFSLSASVNSAIQLVRYFTSSGKIIFLQSVPSIELVNDIQTIQQLIYNTLYRSAITELVTEIGIKAYVIDSMVFLRISDNGKDLSGSRGGPANPGIVWPDNEESPNSEEDMDLALTARLASLIGGKFAYNRNSEGTSYQFELPLSKHFPSQEARLDAPETTAETSLPQRMRLSSAGSPIKKIDHPDQREQRGFSSICSVLIVDDEPVSLFTVKRRIETAGWNVYAKISAWQAIQALKTGLFCDVVLVDSLMPEMSGFEFTKILRKYYPRETLPVIILIDAGRPEEIEEVFKSGADDYIVRPVGAVELLSKIKTHADLGRSVRREREQRDKMAETDKLKTLGWLTAGVAHEINTPNNSALRNVPILKEIWSELAPALEKLYAAEGDFSIRGFSVPDLRNEIPEMFNDLYMGAQHIRKIVEDLKEYARGPRQEGLGPIDVNQSVQYAVRLLKHSIAVSSKNFTATYAQNPPFILGDKLKLTQIVVNILENALQCLPSIEAPVSVSTFVELGNDAASREGRVGITIIDQGIGMTPEVLACIFNPFFTTKREKGGTGLGLPVVAGIVREFGGKIDIESKPGLGTVVTVAFPIYRESAAGESEGEK